MLKLNYLPMTHWSALLRTGSILMHFLKGFWKVGKMISICFNEWLLRSLFVFTIIEQCFLKTHFGICVGLVSKMRCNLHNPPFSDPNYALITRSPHSIFLLWEWKKGFKKNSFKAFFWENLKNILGSCGL